MEIGEQWRLETGPACRRWEGVLAAQATCKWFDVHCLECARVQSPGVCTQSMMSTAYICSDLIGRQQTDHGCRGHGDRISQDTTCRSLTCECMGYVCTQTVWALSPRHSFVLSNSCLVPTALRQFWGSKSGDHRNNPRCWQTMETHSQYMHISVQLLVSLLNFILHPYLWPCAQRYSNTNDGRLNAGSWWHACISAYLMHNSTQYRHTVQF